MQESYGQDFPSCRSRFSSGQTEILACRAIAHFPDESVVVKMKKTRRRYYTGEHALHRFDLKLGVDISERTISKNKADIQSDQRTASSKNKAHKATDGIVLFHAAAVVNPDQ